MKRLLLSFVAAALAVSVLGCTTAGPFVTTISSDGQGGIVVEKAMVQHNSFTGTITTMDPTTMHIKLMDIERK